MKRGGIYKGSRKQKGGIYKGSRRQKGGIYKGSRRQKGGFVVSLPLILAGIGAAGALASTGATIGEAVNTSKHQRRMRQLKRKQLRLLRK